MPTIVVSAACTSVSTFLIQLHSELRPSLSLGVELRRDSQSQILFMVSRSDFRSNSSKLLSEVTCVLGVVVMLVVRGKGAYAYILNGGTAETMGVNFIVDYISKFWSEMIYLIICFGFMFPLLNMLSYHLRIVRLQKCSNM